MSHTINFLQQFEQPERQREQGRRRIFRLAIFVIFAIVAVWLVALLFASGQVVAAALDSKNALYRARDAAVLLDFETAKEQLEVADGRLATAERGFLILQTARFVPWLSKQIDAAQILLVSGREIISSLRTAVDLGGELVRLTGFTEEQILAMTEGLEPAATFDDLPSETKRAILERLSASAADLELLSARIAIARAELASMEVDKVVGPIADALVPLDGRLAEAQDLLRTLSAASRLLPEFAGLDGPSTHLVLLMNNTELRPGGGFIGTFGVLRTQNGDIIELETRDSYILDNLASPFVTESPPSPLQRYNATPKWFFRDANWSPDFAVSAQEAIRLYGNEINAISPEARGVAGLEAATFDGAIGLTPTFVQALLGITGPLIVGGQTFNGDNVTDKLEYQVEVGYVGQGIPELQRKEIIADLVNAIKTKMFSLPLSDWPRVIVAVEEAFEGKQLVVMSGDQELEELITRVGWGGRVEPSDGDLQLIIDANLASLKSDPKVSRAVSYEIFRNTSGEYVGRTTIRYTHNGRFDWKTTRYRTYTRLYVPAGSEFIRAEGSMLDDALHNPTKAAGPVEVKDDLGLTSFGTFIAIEPGESRMLTFEYLLSEQVVEAIEDGSYGLTFLKQIGAQNHELTLDLDFDKNVTSASVPEAANEWGDDLYRLNTKLDQDLTLQVEL